MQRINSTEIRFDRYRIQADEGVLRFEGRRIALAPKVLDTLLALARDPDRVVSKAELMDRIWPNDFVDEANLTQNVYVLRKMFVEHGSGVRIENVPKRGYRLVVPAAAVPTVAARPASPRFGRFAPIVALACIVVLLGVGGPVRTSTVSHFFGPYQLPASALQNYLLGRYYLNRGTAADLGRSIASFERLAHDVPESALGFAGLADGLTSMTFRTADPVARTRLGARAIGFANEAVSRDANSADAYAALGAAQASVEHEDAAAERSFEKALRLDPRNLDALVWYGTALMNDGRVAAARRLFKRAMSVDPSSPGPIASLAWADFLARDFAEAAAFSEQLLRAHHLESIARITLASSCVEMGDYARAMPEVEKLRRDRETQTQAAALLSQIYALRGAPRLARAALARIEARTDPERIGPWDILALAAAYARVGREDAAFVWLARIRSSERRQIARDPRFDQLRKDRRFSEWVSG